MNFFSQHPFLDGIAAYLALALVGSMPAKGTKWSAEVLYDWAYDFLHVAINLLPPSRRPALDPIQPAGPANHPPKE